MIGIRDAAGSARRSALVAAYGSAFGIEARRQGARPRIWRRREVGFRFRGFGPAMKSSVPGCGPGLCPPSPGAAEDQGSGLGAVEFSCAERRARAWTWSAPTQPRCCCDVRGRGSFWTTPCPQPAGPSAVSAARRAAGGSRMGWPMLRCAAGEAAGQAHGGRGAGGRHRSRCVGAADASLRAGAACTASYEASRASGSRAWSRLPWCPRLRAAKSGYGLPPQPGWLHKLRLTCAVLSCRGGAGHGRHHGCLEAGAACAGFPSTGACDCSRPR